MVEKTITILLVEDEDPHAELIQRAFEGQWGGVQIQRAKSLAEARAHMNSQKVSLIIADWRLPDGESMELIPYQRDLMTVPIILMTSYGNERIAVEALKSGALDFVIKSPESLADMPHLAERALGQWTARSERFRMQEALRKSEAQFRLLAENASDMITRLTTSGEVLYISPACKTILGFTPEELTGKNSLDLIQEKERIAILRLFRKEDSLETHTLAHQALHRDGRYVWLESSARAVLDPQTGSITEIQTASRDITDRKNPKRPCVRYMTTFKKRMIEP